MASENDRRCDRLVERALLRGLVTAEAVAEARRRETERAGAPGAPGLIDLLSEVSGTERRLLCGIDETLPGRRLGGFEIGELLGEGGMGTVFRAVQVSLGRAVAVKVLDPGLDREGKLAARFRREARTAARLDHPNVVQPIDFGEDHGLLFFAMELMDGGSAAAHLERRGRYAEPEAVEIGIAIARALEYAEAQGVVHRDVKPDNILFSKHGTPKLGDLGLVLERSGDHPITARGLLVGTPDYMSPEVARGQRDLDVRSDIYSLGVTLFELATGRRPFTGPDPVAVVMKHLFDRLPDPRATVPGLSEAFVAVLRRMTEKAREARYASARELRAALGAVLPPSATERMRELPPEVAAAAAEADRRARAAGQPAVDDAQPRADGSPPRADGRQATAAKGVASTPARPTLARWSLAVGALGVAALGVATFALATRGPAAAAAVDLVAEAHAARDLDDLLFARRGADGGFGSSLQSSDAGTTARALAAELLSSRPPPRELLGGLLRRLREGALTQATDGAARAEARAWVALAAAVAGDAQGAWTAADRARLRGDLVEAQAADDGSPGAPATGPDSADAAALGLAALTALEARDGGGDALDAIERGAARLGARYGVGPDGRPRDGADDLAAFALLEAERLLAGTRGRPLPLPAAAALDALAAAEPAGAVGSSPPGTDAKASARGRRFPWRLLVAERFAHAGHGGRARWVREAARLRASAPARLRELEGAPTLEVAEASFALNLLRARPPLDDAAGSLVALVRERRQ